MVPPHAALRGRNFRLLAGDRARFVGEAVAAVVAESRYAAEDARELIDVDYEPLAFRPRRSRPRAPAGARRHPRQPRRPGDADPRRRRGRAGRGAARRLADASHRPRPAASPWRRAASSPTTTPSPASSPCGRPPRCRTRSASSSADLLELAPHQVRVIAPDVGGGFGAKLIVYPEDVLIPFLALRVGAARALARGPPRAHADRDAGARRRSTRSRSASTTRAACSRCATASSTTPARTRRAAWWCRCSPPPC